MKLNSLLCSFVMGRLIRSRAEISIHCMAAHRDKDKVKGEVFHAHLSLTWLLYCFST